jgi:hypothetical protein
MNEMGSHDLEPGIHGFADAQGLPGIIVALGEMTPGTIVTEEGLAQVFKRHIVSVKRAVQRGELPPPCRLFGDNVWTVGVLIRHIEQRLEQSARGAERTARKIADLAP